MTGISTIITLLPIICSQYQDLKLISQLNNFHSFDHNILLLDARADPNRFINSKGNIPQSLYFFKRYNNNVIGLETLTEIKSKNTFMIVVLEDGQFLSNLNFLHQFKKIQRLQINMKIGVFFSQLVPIHDLRKLFQWFKEHQIINIFAANYSQPEIVQRHCSISEIHIFTFGPFGVFDVINVTGESLKNYFQKHNFNFQQHQLRLGEPFSFLFDEEIWLTAFQMMNATFVIVPNNDSVVTSLDNRIDLIPRMNSPVKLKNNHVYPIRMGHQAFGVPEALPYSEFSAYLLTVTSDDFFGYTLIAIAVVIIFLIISRYIKQKKFLVFESVADVLNLLINDNGYVIYQRLSLIEGFLIVPLTFVGLIIVNGILSNLQSYLTRPINQPQIKTMEDIFLSPFPILIWTKAGADLPEELTNRSTYWRDKIVAMGREFEINFVHYNTSNIYYMNEHFVQMAIMGQKRLGIRGYHIPEIRLRSYYGFYPVGETFLFFDRLNEIILLIRSAGLYDLWSRRYDADWLEILMKHNRERLSNYKEDDIDRFPIPMFIVYLWLASVVVFIIEIIWKNCKLRLRSIWKKFKVCRQSQRRRLLFRRIKICETLRKCRQTKKFQEVQTIEFKQ